jgi:hypothetical protein
LFKLRTRFTDLPNSETKTTVGSTRIYDDEANREQTDQLEAALKAEGYAFKITPVALPERSAAGGEQRRDDASAGTRDSFALAQRIGRFGGLLFWIGV